MIYAAETTHSNREGKLVQPLEGSPERLSRLPSLEVWVVAVLDNPRREVEGPDAIHAASLDAGRRPNSSCAFAC
jgi:hypothetical protein